MILRTSGDSSQLRLAEQQPKLELFSRFAGPRSCLERLQHVSDAFATL